MIDIPVDLDRFIPFNRLTALKIAETADRFKSECLVRSPQSEINIKSILGIMSLKPGSANRLFIEGADESGACEAILDILKNLKPANCRE